MKYLEIILVLFVGVMTLFLSINWNKLNNTNRMIVASIIAFLAIIAVIQITTNATDKLEKTKEQNKEALVEKINSKFGDLNFDGEPVKHFKIGREDDGAIVYLKNGEFETPYFGISIKLVIIDSKLLIYTVVRDTNGRAIAAIDGDTWTVFDSYYEYNNDNGKGFELVTKGDRKVFFQIDYKNNLVSISGFLLNKDGEGYYLYHDYKSHDGYTGSMIPVLKGIKQNYLEEHKISRIFKYPRGKYYGVRL